MLQLAGGVILGVALWLRHDKQISSLLELELDGTHPPSSFYICMYHFSSSIPPQCILSSPKRIYDMYKVFINNVVCCIFCTTQYALQNKACFVVCKLLIHLGSLRKHSCSPRAPKAVRETCFHSSSSFFSNFL